MSFDDAIAALSPPAPAETRLERHHRLDAEHKHAARMKRDQFLVDLVDLHWRQGLAGRAPEQTRTRWHDLLDRLTGGTNGSPD